MDEIGPFYHEPKHWFSMGIKHQVNQMNWLIKDGTWQIYQSRGEKHDTFVSKGERLGISQYFTGCRELIFKNSDLINYIIEFTLFFGGLIYEMLMKFLDWHPKLAKWFFGVCTERINENAWYAWQLIFQFLYGIYKYNWSINAYTN